MEGVAGSSLLFSLHFVSANSAMKVFFCSGANNGFFVAVAIACVALVAVELVG